MSKRILLLFFATLIACIPLQAAPPYAPAPTALGKGAWVLSIHDCTVRLGVSPGDANRIQQLAARIAELNISWIAVKGADSERRLQQLVDFPLLRSELNRRGIYMFGYHVIKGGNLSGELAAGQAIAWASDGLIVMPHDAGFHSINRQYAENYLNAIRLTGKFLAYAPVADEHAWGRFPHSHFIRLTDAVMGRAFWGTGNHPGNVETLVYNGHSNPRRNAPIGQCENRRHYFPERPGDGSSVNTFLRLARNRKPHYSGASIWLLEECSEAELAALTNFRW